VIQPSRLRCFAADFIKSNLNAFSNRLADGGRKIDKFLTLRLVGRAVNDCNILVMPFPKAFDDKSQVPAPEFENFVRDNFAKYLNNSTDAFAYSVTPKTLTENIATAAETRDAFEVLFRAKGGQNDVANFLRKRSEQNRAVVAHPIVVGFGSLNNAEKNIEAANAAAGIRDIDFGWVVASRPREDGSLEQIDGQYSLTVFISAPSWWRTVELSVNTCWISRTKFAELGPAASASNICPIAAKANAAGAQSTEQQKSAPVNFTVRLPPAIPEISHKLGFEVVQQPSIYHPQQQELVVGQHGSLLLEGARLWRSTEVTAGAQRADKISVLPNMEGILAEFKCVLPPTGGQQTQQNSVGYKVEKSTKDSVRVWTSEGVTNPVPLVFVWPENWSTLLTECQKTNLAQPAARAQ
jgi:hypothetical protein